MWVHVPQTSRLKVMAKFMRYHKNWRPFWKMVAKMDLAVEFRRPSYFCIQAICKANGKIYWRLALFFGSQIFYGSWTYKIVNKNLKNMAVIQSRLTHILYQCAKAVECRHPSPIPRFYDLGSRHAQ